MNGILCTRTWLGNCSRVAPEPGSVSLHVQGQVVRPRERALAKVALERFLARVFPKVPRQLVGTSKLPGTTFPGTSVRFLA